MRIQRTPQQGFFTKVPNATARDHGLSFTARGVLAYLLSLQDGAREDIHTLAGKSVEGRKAIAAALNELQERGYLARKVVRGDHGQITTDVVLYDLRDGASSQVAPVTALAASGGPVAASSATNPIEDQVENSPLPTPVAAAPVAELAPEGRAGGEISRSETLLAEVARSDRRLYLSAKDVKRLAPLVEMWFERGADKRLISETLTVGLPERVQHPAGLLRKRLEEKMPQAAPAVPLAAVQTVRHHCPVCERLKAPAAPEGLCEHCRASEPVTIPAASGSASWRDLARAFGPGALPVAA
jgi:hypothetical protein